MKKNKVFPVLLSVLGLSLGACGAQSVAHGDSDADTQRYDAEVEADAESDAEQEWYCPLDDITPNSTVSGTTPHGEFSGEISLFGVGIGECGGPVIYVITDLDEMRREISESDFFNWRELDNILELYPNTWDPERQTILGTGPVHIDAKISGDNSWVEGTITLHEYMRPVSIYDGRGALIEADFSVIQEGWNLSGTIRAPYCTFLNLWCP